MLARQKAAIDRLHRVQEFLAVHAPPETPGYVAQKKLLDDVLLGLAEHSFDQAVGRRQSRGEVARERALMRTLRRDHLKPITEIARVSLADAPEMEEALKQALTKMLTLPAFGISPVKLADEARAMRASAAQHEARFIEAGLPPDFLKQLDAAIDALKQTRSWKAQGLGRQVGGRAGIERQIKRGRAALTGLDAVVRRAFRDRSDVLEKWRVTKRRHGVSGGNGGVNAGANGAVSEVTTVVTPIAAVSGDAASRVTS